MRYGWWPTVVTSSGQQVGVRWDDGTPGLVEGGEVAPLPSRGRVAAVGWALCSWHGASYQAVHVDEVSGTSLRVTSASSTEQASASDCVPGRVD